MKTERYNIFRRVHKNLGCLLFDTGARFQRLDNTDPEEMNILMEQIMGVTEYFEHHIRREEYVIYNAVATIAPFIVSEMERADEKNSCIAFTIEKVIEPLYPMTNSTRQEIITELQTLFFSFTAAVLLQINKEVTVINELLWENYTDDQLMSLEESLMEMSQPDRFSQERNFELTNNTEIRLSYINSVEAA